MFVRWKHKNFTRLVFGLTLCLILVGTLFLISAAPPLSVSGGSFIEGFETATLLTNNWTTSGTGVPWAVSSISPPGAATGAYYITTGT
ncbi:MAG: hypothetical protein OEL89_04745, partial [Candidatus Peregrinibacteria bacterium]|nr:hypothetical protein [Candidatus Peregrinibacteria bacterium]